MKITHAVVIRSWFFVTIDIHVILLLWTMTHWSLSWWVFVVILPFPLLLHTEFAHITAFLTVFVSIIGWQFNLAL